MSKKIFISQPMNGRTNGRGNFDETQGDDFFCTSRG